MNHNKDSRKEERFSFVGLDLFYSPFDDACFKGAAEVFHRGSFLNQSASGMSFTVDRPFRKNEKIIVRSPLSEEDFIEEFTGEVRWCRPSGSGYAVGIALSGGIRRMPAAESGMLTADANPGRKSPRSFRMICPVCSNETEFEFMGIQEGIQKKGIIPIYNCLSCGGTRTITSILSFNREIHLSSADRLKTV